MDIGQTQHEKVGDKACSHVVHCAQSTNELTQLYTLSGVLCVLLGAQAPRLISVLMLTDTLFCNFSFGGMHIHFHLLILSYVSV